MKIIVTMFFKICIVRGRGEMNAYFLSFSSSGDGTGDSIISPAFRALGNISGKKRTLMWASSQVINSLSDDIVWFLFVPWSDWSVFVAIWLVREATRDFFQCYHSWCNLLVVFFSRMTHSLQCKTQQKLARDAYMEDVDTFEIFDPRNPINKRRREASKKAMKDKRRWHQGRVGRFVSKAVQWTSAVFRKSSWKHPKSCWVL